MRAIKADPASLDGHQQKRAALYGLQWYEKSLGTVPDMPCVIEKLPGTGTRR